MDGENIVRPGDGQGGIVNGENGTGGNESPTGKRRVKIGEPIVIDPASVGSGVGDGGGSDGNGSGNSGAGSTGGKRRGRKPGSTNKTAKTPLDLNGIEAILLSTHSILAAMVKVPELALEKSEGEQLAKAIGNVGRHYNLEASQKALDWSNLFMALGMIYGPRLYVMRARRTKPADDNAQANLPGVFPYRQGVN